MSVIGITIKAIGYLLKWASYLIMLAAMIIGSLLIKETTDEIPLWVPLLIAAAAGISAQLGQFLIKYGKKLDAIGAKELTQKDHRSPVIYLRSFNSDTLTSKGLPTGSGFLSINEETVFSEEEQLATVLNQIGPVIAIGAPGEHLPKLGASRFYPDPRNWKKEVTKLLSKSRLAVVRIGTTKGVLWEVREVVKNMTLQKLLLLVPNTSSEYEAFRRKTSRLFPTKLPNSRDFLSKNAKVANISSIRGYIYFSKSGQAIYHDLIFPSALRSNPRRRLSSVYYYSLKPFFESIGIPWKIPEIHPLVILSIIFLALLVLFFVGFVVFVILSL